MDETKRADVIIRNEGTIFLFVLLTDEARLWVEDNVNVERTMHGHNLAVEHRYAYNIANCMQDDGLEVR